MKGKQVLLTGGTGGLGLGVTPAVLETGASTVTIPFHSEKGIQREGLWGESNSPPCKPRLRSRLSAVDFERIRFVKADLNQESAVEQLVNELGRIDVLIHLVGGFSMGATEQFSFADWQKSFALNLDTTFLVCKHSLRMMRQHGYGRIVTVSSRSAVSPAANLAAYCAAKAGVIALTQVIAQETKDMDITANVVLPSVIDTPDNREVIGDKQADSWVKAESIAQVICWLASEAARDLRGAVIPIYGTI